MRSCNHLDSNFKGISLTLNIFENSYIAKYVNPVFQVIIGLEKKKSSLDKGKNATWLKKSKHDA